MRYVATLANEGVAWVASFPDCPGCVTQGASREEALTMAAEALEGWLEVHLDRGQSPPRPSRKKGSPVAVALGLSSAIQLRWAREDAGLTQAALAKRVGVTQQQIAKLELPSSNPTLKTLALVGTALGTTVVIGIERVDRP